MDDVAGRRAAVAVLLLALCGLFVLGGADRPTSPSRTPGYEDLDRNYDAHVGQTVEVGGTVVETEPLVVEFEYDTGVYEAATFRLELEGALPAAVGDDVSVVGEVRPDRTLAIDADRSLVRHPWELSYMYGISVLAVLLVGARLLNEWRVRPRRLQVVPRQRTLLQQWRGEAGA